MFVGGMVLGLLSSNFTEEALRLGYLIINAVIIALIVAIFFLNTHNVHRVLAATKQQKLESVEHHLARAYYRLEELIAENQDTYPCHGTERVGDKQTGTQGDQNLAIQYGDGAHNLHFHRDATPGRLRGVVAVLWDTGRFLPS